MTEPDVIRALPLSSPTSVPGSLVSFEELPHAGGRRIAFAFSHGSRFYSSYIASSTWLTPPTGCARGHPLAAGASPGGARPGDPTGPLAGGSQGRAPAVYPFGQRRAGLGRKVVGGARSLLLSALEHLGIPEELWRQVGLGGLELSGA
jgi:hypothetical protein